MKSVASLLDRHLGILFLLPGIALILLMLTYPVLSNFYFSFTNKHLVYQDTSLIGIENYVYTFADRKFYSALYNTIVWTSASIALQLVLGFGVALLLNLPLKGRVFFRLAMIVPYAFPPRDRCADLEVDASFPVRSFQLPAGRPGTDRGPDILAQPQRDGHEHGSDD